jgi:hypothetical protein
MLHFARKVPSIPVQRRLKIAAVAAARQVCSRRPGWVPIFARAFSLVAVETPALRRAYMPFPFPHLYEHPESVAAVAVSRVIEGEEGVLIAHLRAPERKSLRDLDLDVKYAKICPLWDLSTFRMSLRICRLWAPLRRLVWWCGLNLSGPNRAKRMGTFGISAYGSAGADSLHPLSPLTTLLNYGPLDAGSLDVRLVYDHRVLDGLVIARTLGRMEEVLNDVVVQELHQLAASQRKQPEQPLSA